MELTSGKMPSVTVLIVEDDKDSREILNILLHKKFRDVTLLTAIHGLDGLELFKKHLPDIVMTDVNMPEMGGVQMAEKILEIKPGTKIIMITADTGKAALENSIGKGFKADHYVLKPVDFQKLFAAIEQCIADIASR